MLVVSVVGAVVGAVVVSAVGVVIGAAVGAVVGVVIGAVVVAVGTVFVVVACVVVVGTAFALAVVVGTTFVVAAVVGAAAVVGSTLVTPESNPAVKCHQLGWESSQDGGHTQCSGRKHIHIPKQHANKHIPGHTQTKRVNIYVYKCMWTWCGKWWCAGS